MTDLSIYCFFIKYRVQGGNPTIKKKSLAKLIEFKEIYELCDIWGVRNANSKRSTFTHKHSLSFIELWHNYVLISNTLQEFVTLTEILAPLNAQKKFFIKNLFSKCDQICRKLWTWSHLPLHKKMKFSFKEILNGKLHFLCSVLKKSLMENIFCVVYLNRSLFCTLHLSKEKGTLRGKGFWKFDSSLTKERNYITKINKPIHNIYSKKWVSLQPPIRMRTLKMWS